MNHTEKYNRQSERLHERQLMNPDDIGRRGTLCLADVLEELERAEKNFPRPAITAHEGFAWLREEVEELWDEVKKNPSNQNSAKLRKEAIQVAAMALRFLRECCPKLEGA